MKIGILTFHYAMNYGAVLQAYGLQKRLEEMGHDVHIINYRPVDPFLLSRQIKRIVYRAYSYLMRKRKASGMSGEKFAKFVSQRLNITASIVKSELKDKTQGYDALIVGSDQVWNAHFWGRFEEAFFLDFCKNQNVRKLSYAACFGQPNQPLHALEKLSELLTNFDSISVRNKTSYDLARQYTNKRVHLVADPTLLWHFSGLTSNNIPKEDYALVYCLSLHLAQVIHKITQKLKKECSVRIISISPPSTYPYADEYIPETGPSDFVSLIKGSKYVICSSLHGMIFAVKYGKPFIVTHQSARVIRISDFLEQYGLRDRLIASADKALSSDILCKEINYDRIHQLINQDVDASIDYLEKCLG